MHHAITTLFAIVLTVGSGAAPAQQPAWPSKPIRLIIPSVPGGSGDVLSRPVAQRMSERLGQQVLIEYKPGAGMNIGMDFIAKSAPDGYTFGLVAPTLVVNPGLYAKLPFDPVKDLDPITLAVYSYYVLVANPQLPFTDTNGLVAYAKQHPGKVTFGSWGDGSAAHLFGEVINRSAGVQMVHVPFKGSAPSMQAVIGGQISMMIDPLVTSVGQIRGGKVRAIGVVSARRSHAIPEVPPINEQLPGFDYSGWLGFVAPAGIPRDTFNRLVEAVREAVNAPDLAKRLHEVGYEHVGSTPEAFRKVIAKEIADYGKIIRDVGVKPQ